MKDGDDINGNELEDIIEIWSKTTPGPWKSFVEGRDHLGGSSFIKTGVGKTRGRDIELFGASEADQDFIAIAHCCVPRLVEEIRRLRLLLQIDK